jgi:hypothetical protein
MIMIFYFYLLLWVSCSAYAKTFAKDSAVTVVTVLAFAPATKTDL